MKHNDLAFKPAHELREMLRQEKISPEELANYFLHRIEELNPTLNAFLYINKYEARRPIEDHSDKPLYGIPCSVPDVLHMYNTPTTYGSLLFKDNVQKEDSPEIATLKKSGAVILGKTNLSEFALSYDTVNKLRGPCVNPWNKEFSAGGGSAGAAVAVAAGLVPIALATDIYGALRMTSSYCGVAGLMPTRGRIPSIGKHLLPFTESRLYRKGIIARTMRDIAMLLNVMAKPDPRDPYASISIPPNYETSLDRPLKNAKIGMCIDFSFLPVEPEMRNLISNAAKELEKLGHHIELIDFGIEQNVLSHFINIFSVDRYVMVMSSIQDHPDKFNLLSDQVKEWLKIGDQVTGAQYSMAITYFGQLEEKINRLFQQYDFLLTPTTPTGPYKVGNPPEIIDGKKIDPHVGHWGFLLPFNMSGHPALTLPCGKNAQGMPVGMQLVGRKLSEAQLLSLGQTYENTHPFTVSREWQLSHS